MSTDNICHSCFFVLGGKMVSTLTKITRSIKNKDTSQLIFVLQHETLPMSDIETIRLLNVAIIQEALCKCIEWKCINKLQPTLISATFETPNMVDISITYKLHNADTVLVSRHTKYVVYNINLSFDMFISFLKQCGPQKSVNLQAHERCQDIF